MNGLPTSAESARQRRLNEEAATWLLQLETDDTTESRARFRQWLEESADHVLVFLETTAAYRSLDVLPKHGADVAGLVQEVTAQSGSNVVPLSPPERIGVRTPAVQAPSRKPRTKRRIAAIAAAVCCLGVTSYFLISSIISPTYTTGVGEQRSIKLPDGSMIDLNTRSRVNVRFSDGERQIRLLDGEALFSVARDRTRPFRVLTDSAAVQAIGTQFNVYRRRGETTVSVMEGAVQVSAETWGGDNGGTHKVPNDEPALQASATGSPIHLAAGEQANINDDGHIEKQGAIPVAKVLAWRQRKLDFNHATLEEVVQEFNRYNERQIRIEDPAVKARVLNGVFNADDPGALLKFLAREPDLSIEVIGDDAIVQRLQPQSP